MRALPVRGARARLAQEPRGDLPAWRPDTGPPVICGCRALVPEDEADRRRVNTRRRRRFLTVTMPSVTGRVKNVGGIAEPGPRERPSQSRREPGGLALLNRECLHDV